ISARGLILGGETVDDWVTDMACAKMAAHADKMRPVIRMQAEMVKKELSGKVLTTDETYFRLPGMEPLHVSRQECLETLERGDLRRWLLRRPDHPPRLRNPRLQRCRAAAGI